jgi:endonuclease/exonuclease/phosphatase family metal-dependent hydrolase
MMVKVGTWNLENLFRPGGGAGAPTTAAAYDAKVAALAAVVAHLGPDVLAVQEVGDPAALQDVVGAVPGTWHTAVADPDDRGIRVGLVSRLPLSDIEQVRDFPHGLAPVQVDDSGATMTGLGRPALRGVLTVDGRRLDVVSVHMKSKLLGYPDGRFSPRDEDERARYAVYALHRRAAEAAGVRVYANTLLPEGGADPAEEPAVVVTGDMNDVPEAATTQIVLGPPGSEIGTDGFGKPDAGDGQRLWNLAALIPEDQRYSRVYRGRRELIDHILVSHALVGRVTSVSAGPGEVPSVADNPNALRDEPGSDHRPVLADIDI